MGSDEVTSCQSWGTTVLRVMVGTVFFAHGAQKLFINGFQGVGGFMQHLGMPLPMVSAVVVTILEFFGGLALILGLFTRWVATLIAIEMLVAVLAVHLKRGFFLPGGFEYALTLLAANVALILGGSGAASLDGVLRRRRSA